MTTSALISAGIAAASAAAGGIGSALNRKRAREEELRNYTQAKDYLNSMYYRDPLSTVGNRSLLKAARQNYAEGMDALNNRMAAGGATMENQLAAMKSANQGMDKLYGQLLMGEDARRDRIAAQRMQLDSQHSSAVQSGYMQAAQDWSKWGSQMANAALSYGSSTLLNGSGDQLTGAAWSKFAPEGDVLGAMAQRVDNEDNPIMGVIGGGQNINTPGMTGPSLGGLKGVPTWANDPNWAKAFGKK